MVEERVLAGIDGDVVDKDQIDRVAKLIDAILVFFSFFDVASGPRKTFQAQFGQHLRLVTDQFRRHVQRPGAPRRFQKLIA